MGHNYDREEAAGYLRRDPVLIKLPAPLFARLLPHIDCINVKAGSKIISAGETADHMLFSTSTELIGQLVSGERVVFEQKRAGDEIILGLPHHLMNIVCKEDSQIIKLPKRQIIEVFKDQQEIKNKIIEDFIYLVSRSQISDEKLIQHKEISRTGKRELWGWIATIIIPIILLFYMTTISAPIKITYFSALLTAAACLWVFSLVDEFIPPIFVIAVTIILALTPAKIALEGFGSEALLLFVGVYGLGLVLEDSGIFYRYMLWLLNRIPDGSYWQRLLLIFSGYLISPVISSGNSRLAMLQPLYREMVECLGLAKESIAATSLATATFSGTMLMSPMFLTSKPSNLVVIGLLPNEVKEQFSSFYWFFAAFVPAIVVTLGHFFADLIIFGKIQSAQIPRPLLRLQSQFLGPLSSIEWASIICVGIFLGGAATSKWHHLSLPQISALLLMCLLIFGLVTKNSFQKRIDWSMIFFLLSLDGLTSIMTYLHFNEYLLAQLPDFISYLRDNDALFILFDFFVVILIRLILPTTAGMVTSALLLVPLAPSIGVSAWVIGFLSSLFSDIWFFPYQSSVYTQFRIKEGGKNGRYNENNFIKHNFIMNFMRLLAAYFSLPYWKWLGLI